MNDFSGLVIFDGVCNLCNGFVLFIIKHDRDNKFLFATNQSKAGSKILQQHKVLDGKADSVIYLRNGKTYIQSSAALYILLDIGGIWKLSSVFFIIPKFIRDFVYNLIAKHRYSWFGKRNTCMVPHAEILDRFLI